MNERSASLSAEHATFAIDRTYRHPAARVFRAFAEAAIKRQWFIEGEGWTVYEYRADFRRGGGEFSSFSFGDGPKMWNEAVYHDIVDGRRLVFSYAMGIGDKPFSASLVTITMTERNGATQLVYHEQVTHLDGFDNAAQREEGCRELLEKLAGHLDQMVD